MKDVHTKKTIDRFRRNEWKAGPGVAAYLEHLVLVRARVRVRIRVRVLVRIRVRILVRVLVRVRVRGEVGGSSCCPS